MSPDNAMDHRAAKEKTMSKKESVDAASMHPIVIERWQCEYFQSGTCIVSNANCRKEPFAYGVHSLDPYFYIYGPSNENEDKSQRDRMKCCEDIRDYLNGGERPKWLDDLRRVSENHAEDLDGTMITTTGPSVDRDPPKCFWVQDNSQEAKDARARLMDRLFLSSSR